jgi:hypothetical protein
VQLQEARAALDRAHRSNAAEMQHFSKEATEAADSMRGVLNQRDRAAASLAHAERKADTLTTEVALLQVRAPSHAPSSDVCHPAHVRHSTLGGRATQHHRPPFSPTHPAVASARTWRR